MYGRGYWVWGRKDCFPGADGSTIYQTDGNNAQTIPIYDTNGNTLIEDIDGYIKKNLTDAIGNQTNTLDYTIKHPLTFIYSGTSDWYTNNQSYMNDILWNDRVNKSEYDPCPKGWRVQMDSELTNGDFSDTTFPASSFGTNVSNGSTYSNTAWFPATGSRYYGSGTLSNVGYYGYYWSASVNDVGTKRLSFNLSSVNHNDTGYRAAGCSVRCVQE